LEVTAGRALLLDITRAETHSRAYHHYLLIHFHFSFFLYPFRSIVRVRTTAAATPKLQHQSCNTKTDPQIYAGD
jgi:hypothetical protein